MSILFGTLELLVLYLQPQYSRKVRRTKISIKMSKTKIARRKRSEDLTAEEFKAFKAWYAGCKTKADAEDESGMKRQNIDNVILRRGSGATETINTIRKFLAANNLVVAA